MWTEAHRARHDARLKEIVSLHAVAEVARWLEQADPPRSGRATPYAALVRAIAWHLRVGGSWRALPGSFPAWRPCTAGSRDGWSWDCSTACWARWRADAAGSRAAGRSLAWASLIRRRSSASRCAVHVGTTPARRS